MPSKIIIKMIGEEIIRNTRCLFYASLIIALLSLSSLAGDNAEMKFIGFSENGKYLAFEESGEGDGAGGDYATTYFIDVAKNNYAIEPVVFEFWPDSMKESAHDPLYGRYKRKVAAALKRFQIERGNTGRLMAAHMLADHSVEKSVLKDTYFYGRDGSASQKMVPFYEGEYLKDYDASTVVFSLYTYPVNPPNEAYYELKLNETPPKTPCVGHLGAVEENAAQLELTLKPDINHEDLPPQILQKDTSIPASRKCPYSYNIEQVYVYEGNIAVFLNMYRQGFEGSDMRYLAVTGKIEHETEK